MNTNLETELRGGFRQIRPLHQAYTERLAELVRALLADYGIRVQSVESRTKSEDAFIEKVYREDKAYGDPLREITDISGIRVIAYYTHDVQEIGAILGSELWIDTDNSIDKASVLGEDRFGYQSIHHIVQLPDTRANLTEWHAFRGLKAEIQVRTVLQHAWAAINHSLTYKSDEDVPSHMRRRLHRISALLEAADAEFQDLQAALANHRADGAEARARELQPLPPPPKPGAVCAESLLAYAEAEDLRRRWDKYAEEAGFQPVTSVRAIATARDNLLQFLTVAGITTLAELDVLLTSVEGDATRLFQDIRRKWQARSGTDRPPGAVCFAMIRIALLIAMPADQAQRLLAAAPFGPAMNDVVAAQLSAWSSELPDTATHSSAA